MWPARRLMRHNVEAISFAVLATLFLVVQPSVAAVEITVTISPSNPRVGTPTEVLLRTFTPVAESDLALPVPSISYAAPSGLWNVLYPVPDYPFDVEARSPDGELMKVPMAPDPSDASLYRGTFTPTMPGDWSIAISNFPTRGPVRFAVGAADSQPVTGWIALALGEGLTVGFGSSLWLRRRRTSG